MKWAQKIVVTFAMKPFFNIFFKFKKDGLEYVKKLVGPLLIVSNHKFFLDSFALGAALPFTTRLHPIRIMGETKRFNHWGLEFLRRVGFIKFVYYMFGVFPAIRGQGLETALKEPAKILKNNGVVFLHPEGGVVHEDKVGQFKRGAAFLAQKTDAKILPAAFCLEKKGLRKKYCIKFGPTFSLPENLSTEEAADYMRNMVLNLYKTLN